MQQAVRSMGGFDDLIDEPVNEAEEGLMDAAEIRQAIRQAIRDDDDELMAELEGLEAEDCLSAAGPTSFGKTPEEACLSAAAPTSCPDKLPRRKDPVQAEAPEPAAVPAKAEAEVEAEAEAEVEAEVEAEAEVESEAPPEPPFTCAADVVAAIRSAYDASGAEGAYAEYLRQAADPRLAERASFYIYSSELLRECGVALRVCARVLWNVLEMKLPDAQTARVVGYHLLSLGEWHEAVRVFELVLELAPAEPHSHIDLALAKLHRMRQAIEAGEPLALPALEEQLRSIVRLLVHVLTATEWPKRFSEIEWPCLLLLTWVVDDGEARLGGASSSLWPEDALPASTYRLRGEDGGRLRMGLFVWLGWDTDKTDIDLHVTEPDGHEVYYGHYISEKTGARVSRDFRQGYGPEVYTATIAPPGEYAVSAKYFARHQASATTGSTSAVVWCVASLGDAGKERVSFASVRLTAHKQRQTVLRVRVPNGKGKPSDTWAELEPMPNGTINALLVEKPTAPAAAPRNAAAAFDEDELLAEPEGLEAGPSPPSTTRPTAAAFVPATVLTEEERELAELEASMAAM